MDSGDPTAAENPRRTWPPSKADLEYLYLDERLSAVRIASLYGMRSASAVTRRLKKEGIARPSPADTLRKATDELIDEWARRYQNGESLRQIASGTINPATLYWRLHRRGVQFRRPGEARKAARAKGDGAIFGEDESEIKRLYLDQRLNCRQIAGHYGLACKTEAAAAARVNRRLRELGVGLRQKGFLSRKHDGVAAEWARRYEEGESSVTIARGTTSSSVVMRYLDELGIRRRDGSQAHTKYRKTPFYGGEREMAYLLGFTRGDVHVRRHYRSLRLATGSTHSAQLDLFTSLFVAHGPIYIYPSVSKVAGFEWSVTATVDKSFEFLVLQKATDPCEIFGKELFLSYLAGLFDAEGSLWLAEDRRFSPYWSITNSDPRILDWVMLVLRRMNLHPRREPPNHQGVGRVCLWRRQEVTELLRVLPIRHPEKKAKARIVLDQRLRPEEKRERWCNLLGEIELDRNEMVRLAERELANKGRGAGSARGMMVCLRYLSNWKRFPLDESIWTQTLSWLREYVDD